MKKILTTSILSLILTLAIYAQSGSIDNTFNPNDLGFGYGDGVWIGPILATSIQSDGKIVVGGNQFFSYNGTIVNNEIARLNSDGTLDPTFNPGTIFNGSVGAISIQNDGKIIAGGGGLARLNIDGTMDASFNIGTGFNGNVAAISVQTDGKIIIGGEFTSYNGIPTNRIARLNNDGTLDNTFNIGTGTNTDVWEINIQSDGKIIISGQITLYNGTHDPFSGS